MTGPERKKPRESVGGFRKSGTRLPAARAEPLPGTRKYSYA